MATKPDKGLCCMFCDLLGRTGRGWEWGWGVKAAERRKSLIKIG